MAGHEPGTAPPGTREVAPAERVLEAELVDELSAPRMRRPGGGGFGSWWSRSRWVPGWVKGPRQVVGAVQDLVAWLVRAPGRFVVAVVGV